MTYRKVLPVLLFALASTLPLVAQIDELGGPASHPGHESAIQDRGAPPAAGIGQFREDLLVLISELEKALGDATHHPVVGSDVARIIEASGMALPFPPSLRESIESSTYEEMAEVRRAMTPEHPLFAVPGTIQLALAELEEVELRQKADLCATNYDAFEGFKKKRTGIKGIKRATNVLSVTLQVTNLVKELTGATTEDTPYVGKVPAIPFMVIAGVQDIAIQVLNVISSSIATAKDVNELSIAACCVDPAPSQQLYGRGCDNRDNNCAGGTDESTEDLYAPSLEVDTSVLERCYIGASEAKEALEFAVNAADDCSAVSPSIQLNVATGICVGSASIEVSDASGNRTSLGPLELTVDSLAPSVVVPPLQACYATIADARNDVERAVVTDCTDVLVDIDTVPAECAAQLSLTAVDECGNRAEYLDEVVVDGSPPQVDVRKLLLPSVDGLFCFDSPAEAISAVAGVATISDNCTPDSELDISTTSAGPSCSMTVTTAAMDGCGRVGVDTLPVRIDTAAPAVSCSVATPTLWPADGAMRDVGFSMVVSDDCDPFGDIEIEVVVTSDEPTALARRTLGGDDPYPDAELVMGADGNVETVLLRAERSDYGPADGRLYRIRVIATDGCGRVGQTDCWVDVPRELNKGQGVNTGQHYRADRQN